MCFFTDILSNTSSSSNNFKVVINVKNCDVIMKHLVSIQDKLKDTDNTPVGFFFFQYL